MTEAEQPHPEMYDVIPGLELMRAICTLDQDKIRAAEEGHDPIDLLRSIASVAFVWGIELHGTRLPGYLDARLLDLSVDPLHTRLENPDEQ